jgi:hypothetical protein
MNNPGKRWSTRTTPTRTRKKDGHVPAGQHGIVTFGHAEIAALAHQLWEERGRPEGSPEEDWHRAVVRLRSQNL